MHHEIKIIFLSCYMNHFKNKPIRSVLCGIADLLEDQFGLIGPSSGERISGYILGIAVVKPAEYFLAFESSYQKIIL